MKKYQVASRLLDNCRLNTGFYRLTVRAPQIARAARPGQFAMIQVADAPQSLLRRPLGVHGVRGECVDFLYQVRGPGTTMLSRRRPGETVDLLGPLGTGFDLARARAAAPVIVAGGMGVAPLFFLAERLAKELRRAPVVLIGARNAAGLLCVRGFQQLGCAVHLSTDDGSRGARGYVSSAFSRLRATALKGKPLAVYACGPRPMLASLCGVLGGQRSCAEVSLEEHMACGIGACCGCAVRTTGGMRRVCVDGPVFRGNEVVWEEEAEKEAGAWAKTRLSPSSSR